MDGGGWIPPPPRILCSGGPKIDQRATKLCHNSYLIVTIYILNVLNPKGVPKKIWSMFFEAGVKNQNFKVDRIALKFCMDLKGPYINFFCFLDHMVLGPYIWDMAVFKQKMAIILKWSLNKKIVTAQKSFRMCFYIILGG